MNFWKKADIRAVLYAMVDVMQDALANGQIVRVGELGSLRVSLSSEGKEKPEKVNAAAIKGARVVFTPGKDIKNMLANLSYSKEN
jgi:predicted histone-like DNA-binding protein